jgi:hypothetical protein
LLFFARTLPETSPKEVLMPPTWLVVVAWFALAIAFASAGIILADIFVRRYRQPMRVMEAVWPITALYFGPLALGILFQYWALAPMRGLNFRDGIRAAA